MSDRTAAQRQRVLVLGASGSVGRQIVDQAQARGLAVTAQTRSAPKLRDLGGSTQVVAFEPTDAAAVEAALRDQDVVIFALGVRSRRSTLFSDATRVLLPAMESAGVRRLIAITGVGAGDTRGHGGFVYDRIVFPLFTRHVYADKDLQESLIESSGLDWTIVRPAPFNDRQASGELQALTRIAHDTKLRRVTRVEVAGFVLDQVGSERYRQQKVFIGHP